MLIMSSKKNAPFFFIVVYIKNINTELLKKSIQY